MIKVYKTTNGLIVEGDEQYYMVPQMGIDDVLQGSFPDLEHHGLSISEGEFRESLINLQAPIESQEVWAAGVTYFRSREARMQESSAKGGDSFYDRVYDAPRPELFYKGNAHRIRGHGEFIRIRKDSDWNVPEPELTLCISAKGKIIGYTIGNDVSSRDIEGENPLYLPQAKTYDGSGAIGPCLLLTTHALPHETAIRMDIERMGSSIFSGATEISSIKRSLQELVDFLFRECSFPYGCFLMTGTGIIPPDDFSLKLGDKVSIQIDSIGILENRVGE